MSEHRDKWQARADKLNKAGDGMMKGGSALTGAGCGCFLVITIPIIIILLLLF